MRGVGNPETLPAGTAPEIFSAELQMCSRPPDGHVPLGFVDESELNARSPTRPAAVDDAAMVQGGPTGAAPASSTEAALPPPGKADAFQRYGAMLGVDPGVTWEALERAYLRKNLALIRGGTPVERAQLRTAFDALALYFQAGRPVVAVTSASLPPVAADDPGSARQPVPVYVPPPADPRRELMNPFSFDSWLVNLAALPLVAGLALLANLSPLGFFLKGFHVWMHEFGHATVAWMIGKRALPLPIGWTNVEPEKSNFVYFGVLFLLGVLVIAGWKERKIWPILIALVLAPLQFYMTWRLPDHQADLWQTFGGVGGEFYLSAALMVLFYFQFPEKFKWGACRYGFLFIGASSLLNIYVFWRQVKRGTESIPWGSMVEGEEDGGGDMNILRDDYHWNNHRIIDTYNHLGSACLVTLLVIYVIFALRLDRVMGRLIDRRWPG